MEGKDKETPDEVLVIAAIFGNLPAFDELVLRYHRAAVRTARGIVGEDDAEDVAQDAFLLAFKALPSIDEPGRFAFWLNAITRNRAFRFLKESGKHSRQRVEFDEFLIENMSSLSRPWSNESETKQELTLALEKVSRDYALVLQLHFLDEMPLKRIAAYLGTPISTVKWRMHQGKKLLREEVENLRLSTKFNEGNMKGRGTGRRRREQCAKELGEGRSPVMVRVEGAMVLIQLLLTTSSAASADGPGAARSVEVVTHTFDRAW